MARSRIKTDDQDGAIVTATYESMAAFMQDNGLLQETYILRRADRRPVDGSSANTGELKNAGPVGGPAPSV